MIGRLTLQTTARPIVRTLLVVIVCLVIGGCATEETRSTQAFDSIVFQKSGGIAGINQKMDIDARGRVAINSKPVAQLDETFDQVKADAEAVKWRDLDGRTYQTESAADLFVYRLTYVTREDDRMYARTVVIDELQLAKSADPLRVLVRSLEAMYGRLKDIKPAG